MTNNIVISGSGLWTPPHIITNEELVESYNAYCDLYNAENADAIAAGSLEPKPYSSAEFIEKASGIKQRYTMVKDGALDPTRMRAKHQPRDIEELSVQAEMGCHAARAAMAAANKTAADIDAVIVSCALTERAYPAISIEIQGELGIQGVGFDMLVACSAATFALHRAYEMIYSGSAKAVLVVNPELTSPEVNYCDRDSHFIFGDVSTAMVLEREETCTSKHAFRILGRKAQTVFSNNIRADFGIMSRVRDDNPYSDRNLFRQNGRKVFKEVCPMAVEHITAQVEEYGFTIPDIKRWWLHQANINMNQLIVRKILDKEPGGEEAPIVLDEFANTASAGSIIAFHRHHEDFQTGEKGVICSFGAGYSIGSLLLEKC